MLVFKTLQYKNFLSSGNQYTEIKLNSFRSTLIVGSNGAGKSTILDALTFALFNKPFRKISKNQLINTSNEKDCVVNIEFSIGDDDWKITRGIKPSVFEISKNGTQINQLSSSNDQQKWLEQSILKLNYKTFSQIVVLGSSNFIPFMQLSSQHRREVVEDLLDIKVFSTMNDIVKIKIKDLRDKIKELEYKKENIKDKIELQKNLIEQLVKLNNQNIENNKSKIKNIFGQIKNCDLKNLELSSNLKLHTNLLEEMCYDQDKLKKLDELHVKINQKIESITEDYKFFENNSVCPTCTQKIEEEFRLNKVEQIKNKIVQIKLGKEELQKTLENETKTQKQFIKINRDLLDLNNEINLNNSKINQYKEQIKQLEFEIQELTSKTQNRDSESIKLVKIKKTLEDILDEISKNKEELINHEFIYMLLKDDGAKTKIIKKYLPVINHSLNKYLEIMDFPVNFILDEEFNEKALSPIYEDFSYESFSEGEKMRIDLAILFTWREIAKIKNSINTNLLILDEVFDSSLDEYGTEYFTKIIKYIIEKTNVFVISHKKEDLLDKFDSTIMFEKRKGFSTMIDS